MLVLPPPPPAFFFEREREKDREFIVVKMAREVNLDEICRGLTLRRFGASNALTEHVDTFAESRSEERTMVPRLRSGWSMIIKALLHTKLGDQINPSLFSSFVFFSHRIIRILH